VSDAQVTGAELVVAGLLAEGVDTLFGLPGIQLDWLFDALYGARDRLRVVTTRHEQGAAYMADGYARATGRPGVCAVVPGPGLLNSSAALATAYACSSPVVCLTGQVDSRGIDQAFGLLHEIPHQEHVLGSVTAWSGRALAADTIPGLLQEAFARLRGRRPRPVALELPPDVLQARSVPLPYHATRATPQAPDPTQIRAGADRLRVAARPVIYSGGGTLAAAGWSELQALAELLEAPVVMSVDGRGALSDRHDLAHTGVTGQALAAEADVVLAVGTRLWQPVRVWGVPLDRIVRLDIDPAEIGRHGAPAVGILGDARLSLAALLAELDGLPPRPSRRAELRARKAAATERLASFEPQASFIRAMRAALPDDAIVVNDLTQVTFFATVGFPVYTPRTFLGPGYQGTLGAAFATALGAQAGQPDRVVVAVAGDGGYLYTLPELATQRLHGLPVISVVFNDGAFGNVKRTQQQQFGGRLIASDLVNPDFVALAQSFGVDAVRVSEPAGLGTALEAAVAARRPSLIEVAVGEMANVWPVIGPAGGVYPVLLS
jgi:acetolactate synthase-1/2/3 large subunit